MFSSFSIPFVNLLISHKFSLYIGSLIQVTSFTTLSGIRSSIERFHWHGWHKKIEELKTVLKKDLETEMQMFTINLKRIWTWTRTPLYFHPYQRCHSSSNSSQPFYNHDSSLNITYYHPLYITPTYYTCPTCTIQKFWILWIFWSLFYSFQLAQNHSHTTNN